MQRLLFVLFGVIAAVTVVGLLIAFTRPIKWPANVGPLEWRRAVGEAIEREVEEEVAA